MRLLALALSLTGASAFAAPQPTALGRAFFADWQRGDRNSMYGRLSEEFQDHWSKPDFDAFFAEKPLRILTEKESRSGAFSYYSGEILLPTFVFAWKLTFDAEGRVAGLRMTSDEATKPYPSSHEKQPRAIGFPFSTDVWTVSGAHHQSARSQRYALDLRIVKAGDTFAGDDRDNRSYYAYARTVSSPVDGVVVEVHDGYEDNVPRELRPEDGNSITLKVDDAFYVYLTHLRKGTLLVEPGHTVKRGQPLAQVGNSGHSTEPHLHLEAFDSLPRETADAWPLAFDDVLHNGRRKPRAAAQYGDTLAAVQ